MPSLALTPITPGSLSFSVIGIDWLYGTGLYGAGRYGGSPVAVDIGTMTVASPGSLSWSPVTPGTLTLTPR